MRKVSITLIFVLALLALVSCGPGLKNLRPTGESQEISITIVRDDSVSLALPESAFTIHFTLTLGKDFLDFNDPTWYERARAEIEKIYQGERGGAPSGYMKSTIIINSGDGPEQKKKDHFILEVPSAEWLKENTKRGVNRPFLFAYFEGLPIEGDLRRAYSKEIYDINLEKYPEDRRDLAPMQIRVDGEEIHTIWKTYPEEIGRGQEGDKFFTETLEDMQKSQDGIYLYRFPKSKKYALIQLPSEITNLTAEDLVKGDKKFTLTAEILQ